MKLVVISPERHDPRETAVLGELFDAGLERYHVRKPYAAAAELEAWLRALPRAWRSRLVLHQHHELVDALELGGRHWRDRDQPAPLTPQPQLDSSHTKGEQHMPDGAPRRVASRACHDRPTLRRALGHYDSVLFSPVFPSVSKPGHGSRAELSLDPLVTLLANRTPGQRRTTVLALSGITPATAPRALGLGFDGVAVLGAIWLAADPVRAFSELRTAIETWDGRSDRPSSPLSTSNAAEPTRGPRVAMSTPATRPHAA